MTMFRFPRAAAMRGLTLLLALGLSPMANAKAAELKMLAGGGIAGPLNELAPQFERDAGPKIAIQYDATPGLIKRAMSEPFDLGVVPREVMADAGARARFAPGPTTDIARVGFGVAVRAGQPKPDIGTADKLKAALLKAESIAFLPASAAGAQVVKVFERLGIAEEMKAKTKVQTSPAGIPAAVAKGDAEFGVFLINVLMAPGVDVVGPFPAEVQQELVFTAAVAADTRDADAAKAFIAFLSTATASAVIKAKGMEPVKR
jgi:molybdate transport system substrate-binding protein